VLDIPFVGHSVEDPANDLTKSNLKIDMVARPLTSAIHSQPPACELAIAPEALPLPGEPDHAHRSAVESQTRLSSDFAVLQSGVTSASSDAELALAACKGDAHAATLIWRRYAAKVRSKVRGWMGFGDVEDVVQEVFFRLFAQLPRIREPSALRGFLIGIAFRVAFSELRLRRRSPVSLSPTGELPERCDAFGDRESEWEALWRFAAILGALSLPMQRVFVLRHIEKLELADVAAAMGISLATVKRHLERATGQLVAMAEGEQALADYIQDVTQGLRSSRSSKPASANLAQSATANCTRLEPSTPSS
jgi:RNA polymerase sigma-70 factor (ECF subfamily)